MERTLSPAAEALTLSPENADPIDVIRRWHDTNPDHPDEWGVCTEQPCYTLVRHFGG